MSIFPVSFLLRKRDRGPEGRTNRPASPPGSKSIEHFTSNCVACHLCVSRCPTRVLQPSLLEYGLASIMQPVMDYGTGFCEYQCNICSQVCPTGAILPLKLEEKQRSQIGTSHFIKDRCIVFTDGTACGACAEVCPSGAVRMVRHTEELTKPETDENICIGCGNCEFACPVLGGKAIYVVGKEVHDLVPKSAYAPKAEQVREEQSRQEKSPQERGGEDEGGKEDFPF
jgi:formate hydrogenlyase subunit 6/NADH:ubiquinone oxidoreductase subunit I